MRNYSNKYCFSVSSLILGNFSFYLSFCFFFQVKEMECLNNNIDDDDNNNNINNNHIMDVAQGFRALTSPIAQQFIGNPLPTIPEHDDDNIEFDLASQNPPDDSIRLFFFFFTLYSIIRVIYYDYIRILLQLSYSFIQSL